MTGDEGGGQRGSRRWLDWPVAWHRALYGRNGFYRRPEGPAGHFRTPSHVPEFAAAVAALARLHACSGVLDVGAGRGELLAGVRRLDAGLRLAGVDVVPAPAALPPGTIWVRGAGGGAVPDVSGVLRGARWLVIAVEWLDVVPCPVLELGGDGVPHHVQVQPATGAERLGEPWGEWAARWCQRWWPTSGAQPGDRVEVGQPRDEAWAALVAQVASGVVVAVDYGHDRSSRPRLGSLAGFRAGRAVPPVPDGSCDVTAHVALDSVASAGRQATGSTGVRTWRGTLAEALLEVGAGPWPAELADPGGLGGFGWVQHSLG